MLGQQNIEQRRMVNTNINRYPQNTDQRNNTFLSDQTKIIIKKPDTPSF